MALVAVSGTISYGMIVLFTAHLSIGVLKAKLLAEGILFLANFLVQRDLIFTGGGGSTLPPEAVDPLAAPRAPGAESDLPR
jgi:hypothetical protein